MIKHNKFLTFLVLGSLLLFLNGCATVVPKLEKPIVRSRVFECSFDNAWQAVIRSITASGEFVNVAEKESGLISFQKSIPIDKINEYALAPSNMIWDNAIANISIILIKQDESTVKVTINTKIWGTGRNAGEVFWYGAYARAQQIEMGSRGKIESEYLHKIANFIPGAKTYEWLEEENEKLLSESKNE